MASAEVAVSFYSRSNEGGFTLGVVDGRPRAKTINDVSNAWAILAQVLFTSFLVPAHPTND